MKVAVYGISKNEADNVEGWASSAREADAVVLVDTGSSDATVKRAKKMGVDVSKLKLDEFRFDVARNAALAAVPFDFDVCIALDLDERLPVDWRDSLEAVYNDETTRWRYEYVWSWHSPGEPDLVYHGDKIHRRHGYAWRLPVHETLQYAGPEVETFIPGLRIEHHPDSTKARNYLPLLELSALEAPNDTRTAHYLAREYMFQGQSDRAVEWFKRHLLMQGAWQPERAQSARYLWRLTQEVEWLEFATKVAPERREVWLDLADVRYQQRDWAGLLDAAMNGLKVEHMPLEYLTESAAWGPQLHDYAGIAAWELGFKHEARAHGLAALELAPGDARLAANARMYEGAVQ